MNRKRRPVPALAALALLIVAGLTVARADSQPVKAWEENIVIPTYLAGPPEPNPMFDFGQASQGAAGKVYPYPLYDNLTGQKADKTYRIVYLENEYIKLGILPEIGGRLFEAIDKTNGYNFVYRQHVIKPALIGLIGAWISGGVEWNIPHHHRATTFLPVQHEIVENADGSKTVWVGELEVRHRMRWAVGYTLYPGSSRLEASVRIVNRTPTANSMLCFANVAVHVNDDYQVIFPPRTQYVTFHAKNQFTTWPIATGVYNGRDYGQGVDVSWWKNHSNATSMFAWNYEDDFFAGYDHGKHAGTMSVADHHVVPGKKLWTWGTGPRGRMWDKILTDEDGPYIELMVGGYSDNQPDYSWLAPMETRAFDMCWYPFRDIDGVKNANRIAAVNLEVKDGKARVGFTTTSAHDQARVRLTLKGKPLFEKEVAINPGKPFVTDVALPEGADEHDLRASLRDGNDAELIAYSPVKLAPEPKPEPVKGPPAPGDIKTNEELYLAGLRIEQFHNAALKAETYWNEAIQRDPGDARVNTALGIRKLKQARYTDAEAHFRAALKRTTANYTTPKDAEPLYYLGLALKAQGRLDEAYETLYKSTWDVARKSAAFEALAEIATTRGNFADADDLLDQSLEANALNLRAMTLTAAVLRHQGRPDDALKALEQAAQEADPLDVRIQAERALATKTLDGAELHSVLIEHPATLLEVAAEYADAGLWSDGLELLAAHLKIISDPKTLSPLAFYYAGDFAEKLGRADEAAAYRHRARAATPDYAFPFQDEMIGVLRRAMKADPQDARAPYYLGNLLFDWQPDEAVALWEHSAELDPSFPIVHRNLAVACSHRPTGNDLNRAVVQLEQAVSLPQPYPMHFQELDELYEAVGKAPADRLAMLESHQEIAARRDDALAREIALKVFMGQYDDAIRLLTGRKFQVWEGGTLTVADSWTDAHLLRGRKHLAEGRPADALTDFQAAGDIPDNLPSETRGSGGRDAELTYWTGMAEDALGHPDQARKAWENVGHRGEANGPGDRGASRFYHALALQKLGRDEEARTVFQELAASSREREPRKDASPVDPTASSRIQRTQRMRLAGAHYAAGLGALGLRETDRASQELKSALQVCPDHLGAKTALETLTK